MSTLASLPDARGITACNAPERLNAIRAMTHTRSGLHIHVGLEYVTDGQHIISAQLLNSNGIAVATADCRNGWLERSHKVASVPDWDMGELIGWCGLRQCPTSAPRFSSR